MCELPEYQRFVGALSYPGVCRRAASSCTAPLPADKPFYAATYPRAGLDLLLTTTADHKQPAFLQAIDILDEGDLQSVLDQIGTVRTRIKDRVQLTLIVQWIDEQRLSANT